ncbi:Phosphoribosyl-AMP cyclohydrolase / Phosphoribosyl-ATP pyrophosphatase [invertebrate metagenome]|uniref:phosphoribosyl-ATP diphosphatase n=1 Tax=invertebrate metagenome TaxID=1711999 RepID=A0A484H5B0_9ZZZZ
MNGVASIIDRLYEVVVHRKGEMSDQSYTAALFASGRVRIAQKLGEEALETALATLTEGSERVVYESADLLYHLTVLWADVGIHPKEVWCELEKRFGRSGLQKRPEK